jgi:hypothetical protein
MNGKVANLAALILAIGLLAAPARADTPVRVTVQAPDGGPAAGVAVTIRQVAGYGAAGDVEPPAVVGAAATDNDGTVSLSLADTRPYDVYSVAADDRVNGRRASMVLFAAANHWPEPTVALADPLPAINLERTAAAEAAASCDQAGHAAHVRNIRAAIAQKEQSVAALENAIAQYARANDLAAPTLDAARTELAAARLQPAGSAADARVAMLEHYVLLRVLADNLRAGLEADRANERNLPALEMCSNETKAGVEMLARCPPGWQLQEQTAQAGCHQRSSGTGRERS